MPKLTKIPIEEAKQMKRKAEREGPLLHKYKMHINSLALDEAGKFKVKDNKEAYVIRARLKRAAEAAGETVVVRKRGDDVVFWREKR